MICSLGPSQAASSLHRTPSYHHTSAHGSFLQGPALTSPATAVSAAVATTAMASHERPLGPRPANALHAILPGAVLGTSLHMARSLTACRSGFSSEAATAADVTTAVEDNSDVSQYMYHPGQFEPHMDPSVLYTQVLILALVLAMAAYWWFVLVPSERQSLAKAKRKGAVGEYLLNMESQEDRKLERWFYSNWLQTTWFSNLRKRKARQESQTPSALAAASSPTLSEQEDTLSSAASGTLSEHGGVSPDQVDASVPVEEEYKDTQPAFFSFDNPIVLSATLVMLIGLLSVASH